MRTDNINIYAYFYAKVIFASAIMQKNLSQWEKILEILVVISQVKEIKNICFFPQYTPQQRLSLITEIYCDMQVTLWPTALNFIRLLFENRHFALAPHIIDFYHDMQNDYNHVIPVRIVSAQCLAEEEKSILMNNLIACYECQIKPSYSIDKDLIGGAILYVKDKVIDASVSGQLQQLKDFLR